VSLTLSGRCRTRTCDFSRVKVLIRFSPDDTTRRQTPLTRTNDNTRRREKTAHDSICGAFCGAKQLQSGSTWSSHSISGRATFKRRRCLQQVDELAHGNPGLSKNYRECPSSEFPVSRDNNRSTFMITKFHVATALTNLFKAKLPKCRDGLRAGNNG
jgi:hypothetical protein